MYTEARKNAILLKPVEDTTTSTTNRYAHISMYRVCETAAVSRDSGTPHRMIYIKYRAVQITIL